MRRAQLFLILALALFGLTAPLIRWLVLHGGSLSGAESIAISFCNVLFVGNLCAGLVFAAWFGPRRVWREWLATGSRVRIRLAGVVLLSIAIPSKRSGTLALDHCCCLHVAWSPLSSSSGSPYCSSDSRISATRSRLSSGW